MTDICVLRSNKICPFCRVAFYARGRKVFCSPVCKTAQWAKTAPGRFWAKVDKGPHPKGCWLYTGFLKWDGYGWLARYFDGKVRYLTAHRYAWILAHGPVKDGLHIMHLCDVPACCNPEHLKLGTHAENMADMAAKGRVNSGEIKKYKPVLHPDRIRPKRAA